MKSAPWLPFGLTLLALVLLGQAPSACSDGRRGGGGGGSEGEGEGEEGEGEEGEGEGEGEEGEGEGEEGEGEEGEGEEGEGEEGEGEEGEGEEGEGEEGEGEGGAGENPFGQGLPSELSDPVADRILAAARRCGYQSPNTVPAGWRMQLVGEQGCAVFTPPEWQSEGAGTNMVSVSGGEDGETGFLFMAGVPDAALGVQCTPAGVTDFMDGVIEYLECRSIQRRYWVEGIQDIAGVAIPKADYVFTCDSEGQEEAGYLWITIQGTQPLCTILVMGFWMPSSQIEDQTCGLTQVFQSSRCPQGGGFVCDEGECASDCRQAGFGSGSCVEDACRCS